jgi:hypothetical protein
MLVDQDDRTGQNKNRFFHLNRTKIVIRKARDQISGPA